MRRLLLDTSVVISDLARYGETPAAISVATVAELHFGILLAKTEVERADRLARLATVRSTFAALPIDEAVAANYGELAARVVALGRQPRRRAFDLLIAATARTHGAALVTNNVEDFKGLESLVELVKA